MAKVSVNDFDPDVCMGRRGDVTGVCPKLVDVNEDTGRPVVDRLAKLEGFGLRALGGGGEFSPGQFKCSACGCNLPNLQLFEQAPETCPRIPEHGGRRR